MQNLAPYYVFRRFLPWLSLKSPLILQEGVVPVIFNNYQPLYPFFGPMLVSSSLFYDYGLLDIGLWLYSFHMVWVKFGKLQNQRLFMRSCEPFWS